MLSVLNKPLCSFLLGHLGGLGTYIHEFWTLTASGSLDALIAVRGAAIQFMRL